MYKNQLVLIASRTAQVRRRWRQGLQREKYTIFEVAEHAELKQALVTLKPAVLLLDFSLLGLKGVKGVSAIYQLSPQSKILVFTDTLDDAEGLATLEAGAKGYCRKSINSNLLRRAVEVIQKGEIWIGRKLVALLLEELTALTERPRTRTVTQANGSFTSLTPRERDISHLIANGASNKEMALHLNITERTVKAHLTAIFRKVGVSDRLRLALLMAGHQPE